MLPNTASGGGRRDRRFLPSDASRDLDLVPEAAVSRPTDTERGARIAYDFALERSIQGEIFAQELDPEFWQRVVRAARDQLDECEWSRCELSQGRAP